MTLGKLRSSSSALARSWVFATGAFGLILTPGEIQAQTGNFNYRNGHDDGAGVYAGAVDTNIRVAAPNTNSKAAHYLWVDGAPPTQQLLIRFDDIVGSGPGQIPPGASIAAAKLVLATSDAPGSDSVASHSARMLLQAWNGATLTWNSAFGGDGIQSDDVEASASVLDTTIPVAADSTLSLDVTDAVQNWVSGAPNHGIVLLPGGGDALGVRTSEDIDLSKRPLLEVFACSEDSFADLVDLFSPAILFGEPAVSVLDPDAALGPPDYPLSDCSAAGGPCAHVALGSGGSITLQFVDNVLTGSGDSASDLWIFEIGPDIEDTFVEISSDGLAWEDIGKVYGSESFIDIDAFGFGPEDSFRFVRLTDDPSEGLTDGWTVGADIDAVCALSSSDAAPGPTPEGEVYETQKLYASDGQAEDSFGQSVAIFDDFVLIGAPGEDHFWGPDWAPLIGAAYLYIRDASGVWVQSRKLTAYDGAIGQLGTSVAIRGKMAFAGAPGERAVYVFERNGVGDWPHFQKITIEEGIADDSFGISLAVSGDSLVVGSAGRAYVFEFSVIKDEWILSDELDSPIADDGFGLDVAIDVDFALVGALADDFAGSRSGAAYVFERNPDGKWLFHTLLRPGDLAADYEFGHSVGLSGSSAFISASWLGGAGGQAYVYDWTEAALNLTTTVVAEDRHRSVEFGWSVALQDDIAVSADMYYPESVSRGAAYVFVRDSSGAWPKHSTLRASDAQSGDYLGIDVAISGTTVVVGAHGDDDRGELAGAAYIFEIDDLPVPTETPEILIGPQSHTVSHGQKVALSVVATGSEALSYQWRKDGVDIPEATNPILDLVDVNRGASGSYSVVVSSSAGSSQSTEAVLRVLVPQHLKPLEPVAGGFILRSGDYDGYPLQDADKDNFIVQESKDFVQWKPLMMPPKSHVESGTVTFMIPHPGINYNSDLSARAMRVIEEAASGGP